MDLTTAFIRSVGDGKIEIAVNFGPLSGREATLAEVDRLARRLLEVAGDVRVDSIRSHDMGPHHEAIVHQVVATATAPASAASTLRDIAEAWAAECAAERSLEPLGSQRRPRRGDRFVVKPRYSAFDSTPLSLILRELEIERVVLAGMSTEGCVAQTAIAAREEGLKVTVVDAACATADDELEQVALAYLERVVGARLGWPDFEPTSPPP